MVSQLKALAVLTVFFASEAFGQPQTAQLYAGNNQNGHNVAITSYYPNLGSVGFDNRARSACVTGVWLLYQDVNYNPSGGRAVVYIWGQDNFCTSLRSFAGVASSIRYAGTQVNYREDTFTLYQHEWFQGEEEYILNAAPNLNLIGNHASIITTGSSDWTLYDRPNYQGNTICLRVPGGGIPSYISDLSETSIPRGSIRSVRKGCPYRSSSSNVTLTAFSSNMNGFSMTS